jgi:DNA-binding transcriptional LysR family regulator
VIDELEALAALHDAGTMTRAATRLRVTQSAVSKRIAALTDRVGVPLLKRDGRRVRLTPAARDLLARTRPLVAELRAAVAEPAADTGGRIAVGVSESILASWGPEILARVGARLPEIDVALSAHRSLVAIERVRAGEYHLALCAGTLRGVGDLTQIPLAREPMVLVPEEGRRVGRRRPLAVITIEPGSASWQSMRPQLARLRREGADIEIGRTVQSFTSVVQLARAGFGVGLAPGGVAAALGAANTRSLPPPGIDRPIALYGRAATLGRRAVAAWVDALREAFRLPGAARSFLMPP